MHIFTLLITLFASAAFASPIPKDGDEHILEPRGIFATIASYNPFFGKGAVKSVVHTHRNANERKKEAKRLEVENKARHDCNFDGMFGKPEATRNALFESLKYSFAAKNACRVSAAAVKKADKAVKAQKDAAAARDAVLKSNGYYSSLGKSAIAFFKSAKSARANALANGARVKAESVIERALQHRTALSRAIQDRDATQPPISSWYIL